MTLRKIFTNFVGHTMMWSKTIVISKVLSSFILLVTLTTGCGHHGEEEKNVGEEVVVEAGDSVLLLGDVLHRIPGGLSEADSTAMFEAIVKSWTERIILQDFARENIDDLDRIEKMVDEYRTRLIVDAYRMGLRDKVNPEISREAVRKHYEGHPEAFRLERPLIKGIYLKLPDNASNLNQIRQWVFSGQPEGIDKLEAEGLREAMQYSFFEDKWMDIQTIVDEIPYRFYDLQAFVDGQKNFETSYNGNTYLLHISNSVAAGKIMPFEYAEPVIRQSMVTGSTAEYEKKLIRQIITRAEKEGRLKRYKVR